MANSEVLMKFPGEPVEHVEDLLNNSNINEEDHLTDNRGSLSEDDLSPTSPGPSQVRFRSKQPSLTRSASFSGSSAKDEFAKHLGLELSDNRRVRFLIIYVCRRGFNLW